MLSPANEAELADAVTEATATSTPLEIRGGGTRAGLGRPVQAEKTLSTSRLAGITLYEPGALTLVVKAGTPLAEVEAALAVEGQMLPFEPMDHRAILGTSGEPTIGGVVACGVSGPRRIQAGACRDATLGVRFVNGKGEVVKSGGRVMKNVTGYDLVKLMCGSFGTLGVLSEISFKVLPKPEAEATLVCKGLSAATGVAALSAALGSPFGITGAAHWDGNSLVRIEGLEGSVAYRGEQLQGRLGSGWEIVTGAASAALWREVRDVGPFAGCDGAIWRLSVKPADGPVLSDALRAEGLDHSALFDWGGGLVWLLAGEDGDAGASLIRHRIATMGGHATLVRASAATRAAVDVFEPEPAPLAAISAGLRAKFDPAGVLNPGRMG
ncbi:MAG TPA: glycolate oxidase subunit GlcE [Thermohalobaculum sp.]|nr:glycolate oxidase subunit GlcE [Thermohalobaculum sp.]